VHLHYGGGGCGVGPVPAPICRHPGGICRISLLGLVPGFSSLRSRGPLPLSCCVRSLLTCNDISYLRMTPNESPLDTSEDPSVCNGSCRNANYCSFFAFSIVSYEGLMTDNLRTSSRCCWLTSLTWIQVAKSDIFSGLFDPRGDLIGTG